MRSAKPTGYLFVLGFAGAADDDLIGFDGDGHVTLAGPVVGVGLNILDRGVEPETVSLVTVVKGAFKFVACAATATSPATPAATTGSTLGLGTVGLGVVQVSGFLRVRRFTVVAVVLVFTVRFAFGGGSGGFFLGLGTGSFFFSSCGLDLGFNFVAQINLGSTVGIIAGRKVMLASELTEFGSAHFELMGNPGIGAALLDPGTNLVELGA